MKTGFTLIELLGVIALLGILAAISVPIIDNSLNKAREGLNKTQEKQIIKGAEDYYAENLSELPQCTLISPNTICINNKTISLNELQTAGYLPLNILDEKNGKNYDPAKVNVKVTLTKTKNGSDEVIKYDYEISINE